LDAAGLLAPAPVKATNVVNASARFSSPRIPYGDFPDFNEYLSRKWKADDNRPDRSSAEMAWCCAALRMGFSAYAVEDELRRVTLKGKGRSDNYERKTVDNAARWLASQPDTRSARVRMTI
jgi:hypothetical protein